MASLRHERSRLLDVAISLTAGLLILMAVNVRTIWTWARDKEEALTGSSRVTSHFLIHDTVDMLDRWLRALELHAYDQRMALRTRLNPRRDDPRARERLLFVEIDDFALQRFGRWPWPRSRQAEVVATLKKLGARAVLTDIEYPEPSEPAPGAEHPDDVLARALAEPSAESPRGRPGPPDGSAFGVAFLESGTSDLHHREHLRRRIIEWAIQVSGEKSPRVPAALRLELEHSAERAPDALVTRLLLITRFIKAQPMATVADLLLAGVLSDLTPPTVPADLAGHPPQHIALILSAAMGAVAQEPEASQDRLARLTLQRVQVDYEKAKGPNRDYLTRFLPGLVEFCRNQRSRIAEHTVLLDEIRGVVIENWIRREQERRPNASQEEVGREISELLQLPPGERHELADRLQKRRRALDIMWRRDLHAVPAGNILERLPKFGRLNPPVERLAASYRGIGISTVERDQGGVVRSQRMVFRVESTGADPGHDAAPARIAFHGSIPVLAFLRDLDLDAAQVGDDYLRLPARHGTSDVVIPIDEHGRTIIDFRGKWHEDGFAHVSAAKLLYVGRRWREREAFLSRDQEYVTRSIPAAFLRRWTAPEGRLPLPVDGLFAGAVACVTDAMLLAPTRESERIAAEGYFKLALNTHDLLDAVAEARASGNAAELKEANAILNVERGLFDTLVTELPQLESELRHQVRGATCLVGVTSTSTTDVSATPLQELYVNLGVHATLLDQMLRGRFLFRPPWKHVDMWILLAYLALVPLVLPAISIRKGAIAVGLLVFCHMVVSSLLLVVRGIWIDATTPVLAMLAAYGLITIRRYIMEERQKDRIRGMFQTYLDPRVVEAMLLDDALFKEVGGTTREITAFFSDIEGFTTISELLDSDELSAMLQQYLTPMTASILQHGGLRDKYIGDAIVAIFGAPYPSEDHAAKACLASIEQVEKLEALKAEWVRDGMAWYRKIRERGLDLSFRIGLNTGRAKVGNFGSADAKNYTMIGDTVNLASRLEGANKAYKSRILISETTYQGARGVVEARELDLLRVVGKLVPVTVYEVLGRKDQVDPSLVLMSRRFAEALALYRARKFEEARKVFEEIHATFPHDGATKAYLKRLDDHEFLASLKPDWDGAFISKEK